MKIPEDVYLDIKSRFPHVIFHTHEGKFTKGLGVEIHINDEVIRNGWIIDNNTDWQDIKHKAIAWLTSRYPS